MTASDTSWTCTRRTFLQASAGATALAVAAGGLVSALDEAPATFASARALPTADEAIAARHARHRIEATEGAFVSRHDPWHTCDQGCCGARTAHEF